MTEQQQAHPRGVVGAMSEALYGKPQAARDQAVLAEAEQIALAARRREARHDRVVQNLVLGLLIVLGLAVMFGAAMGCVAAFLAVTG